MKELNEQELKTILNQLDDLPLPPKEKILAACETSFHEIPIQKTKKSEFKPIAIKKRVLQYAAMAACLCLLITGVFGGLGLWRQGQTGPEVPAITSPSTQKGPDLPIGSYPPEQVDYENMSMVEYMELHPDFLSYKYIPWEENFAFAHLEILWVEDGCMRVGVTNPDGTYREYSESSSMRKEHRRVHCRVIEDAWGMLEAGSEIDLFLTPNHREQNFVKSIDSFLLRMEVLVAGSSHIYRYENEEGVQEDQDVDVPVIEQLGFFPVIDGKIELEGLESHLAERGKELCFEDLGHMPHNQNRCEFSCVSAIVADGMEVETALKNLSVVYEKYQTGEYNNINISLVSKMNYSEYCRMVEGKSTIEDFKKFPELALEYAQLPGLFSREIVLSDGTICEFWTRVELTESTWEELMKHVAKLEKMFTDESGVLDAEACIQGIKKNEWFFCYLTILELKMN